MTIPQLLRSTLLLMLSSEAVAAPPLRVHAWTKTFDPDVNPMVWVADDKPPQDAAFRTIPLLRERAVGDRVLLYRGSLRPVLFLTPGDRVDFARTDPAALFKHGWPTADQEAWFRQYLTLVRDAGITLEAVFLDQETGVTTWHIPEPDRAEWFKRLQANRDAIAKFPEVVRQASPELFADARLPGGEALYEVYNVVASHLLRDGLRRAYVTPLADLHPNATFTNYGDLRPSFPVFDLNGWALHDVAATDVSSPQLYLAPEGNRYAALKKDPRWNRFIDTLNVARSARNKGTVVPWIASPSYSGDVLGYVAPSFLWDEQQRHLRETGVEKILYWNPGPPYRSVLKVRDDDRHAAQVWTELRRTRVTPAPAEGWTAIPMDADVVQTGDVVTTYAGFLKTLRK